MVLFTQQMSNKWNCVISLVIRDAKLINLRVKVKSATLSFPERGEKHHKKSEKFKSTYEHNNS